MTRPLSIILLSLVLCYFRVVDLGFVSDDHGLISHPITGIGQQSFASIFSNDLWHFQQSQSGYYRPLMMLSLLMDHAFFGDWAGGYHLHSLLWHLLTVGLLFAVLRRPFGDGRASVAASIFGFHPLVSEQVCFISARNDSMAIALGLAAVLMVMPSEASSRRCLAASIFAAAACLSKEIGVLVLCLLPMMDWARGKMGAWHRYGALAAGAVAWLYIREMLGPGLLHSPAMNGAELLQSERLTVLATLLSKIVWPLPLTDSMHIAYLPTLVLPALAAVLFLMGFLVAVGGRWGQMGILFSVLALIPGMMAIASRFLIGERYLTLPLIGACFGIAAVLPRATKSSWAVIIALPLASVSHLRIADWQSDLTLAKAAYTAQPTGYTASWLGHELLRTGQPKKALPLFDEATRAQPPTCDFAGEWLRAVRIQSGGAAGIDLGRTLWDRKCAASPGVRGEWAHSFMANGDFEMAQRILTPPPQRCDKSIVVPLAAWLQLEGDTQAANRCIQTSGLEPSQLEEEIQALIKRQAEREPTGIHSEENSSDAPPHEVP